MPAGTPEEIAEAKRQLERALVTQDLEYTFGSLTVNAEWVRTVLSALGAAERDTARLDWMAANRIATNEDGAVVWWVVGDDCDDLDETPSPEKYDMREAIDYAMANTLPEVSNAN